MNFPGTGYTTGGYHQQPQPMGYPPVPMQGYPPSPMQGYPPAPSQGYPPSPMQGYPPAPMQGYPPAPMQGYPPAPAQHRQPPPLPNRQSYPPTSSPGPPPPSSRNVSHQIKAGTPRLNDSNFLGPTRLPSTTTSRSCVFASWPDSCTSQLSSTTVF